MADNKDRIFTSGGPSVSAHPVPRESIMRGGPVTGLIAGIIMAAVAMLTTAAQGMGFWLVPKMIAATFLGVDAVCALDCTLRSWRPTGHRLLVLHDKFS